MNDEFSFPSSTCMDYVTKSKFHVNGQRNLHWSQLRYTGVVNQVKFISDSLILRKSLILRFVRTKRVRCTIKTMKRVNDITTSTNSETRSRKIAKFWTWKTSRSNREESEWFDDCKGYIESNVVCTTVEKRKSINNKIDYEIQFSSTTQRQKDSEKSIWI